jgi:hypothetical protein
MAPDTGGIMAKRKRRGPAALAADSSRMYDAAVAALERTHAAAVLPSPEACYGAHNSAEVAHAIAADLLGKALDEAAIASPEAASAAGVGWYVDPETRAVEPATAFRPAPALDAVDATEANVAMFAWALQAFARGLMPRHLAEVPLALLAADPDGHTRGLGRDLGDGPILWRSVALWHAIDRRDRGEVPR